MRCRIGGDRYIAGVCFAVIGCYLNRVRSTTPGLDADKHGCLITNGPDGLTSRPMVYAGGDAVTGAATVILAMGAGKEAARAIDAAIKVGKTC